MTLPHRVFDGATFFTDVRPLMDANRGLFAGENDPFYYACMDASFYRMEHLVRPSTMMFTDAALAEPGDIRVVANGQFFTKNKVQYCWTAPCPQVWFGSLVQGGINMPGEDPDAPDMYSFGQGKGRTGESFFMRLGNPFGSTVPAPYWNAMGNLIPLVKRNRPFGATQTTDSTGRVTQFKTNLGSWAKMPGWMGKIVYGVHRAGQVVFVLSARDVVGRGGGIGLNVPDLITRLVSMGVDDAALGDGGTSSTLVVDGKTIVYPTSEADHKNQSIPVGPKFRLQELVATPAATLRLSSTSMDTTFTTPVLTGAAATIRLVAGGFDVVITSLGSAPGMSAAQAAAAVATTLPLTLHAPTSLVTRASYATGGNASADLTLSASATDDGRITGGLLFITSHGRVAFDVTWPVTTL